MRSLLESYGIESVVFGDTITAIAPHYTFGQGGSRLMVREEDREEAVRIVKEYESGNQSADN